MKQKIKTLVGPVAAFIGVHSLCCAPLLLPGLFGAMISGAVIGSVAVVGSVLAFGTAAYLHNRQKHANPKAHDCDANCAAHQPPRSKTFVRSKPFRQAALISGGLILGSVFNAYVVDHSKHDHSQHGHHHHEHREHSHHEHTPMKSFSPVSQAYIAAANTSMCRSAGYDEPVDVSNVKKVAPIQVPQ